LGGAFILKCEIKLGPIGVPNNRRRVLAAQPLLTHKTCEHGPRILQFIICNVGLAPHSYNEMASRWRR
jgi:hypothetical protein